MSEEDEEVEQSEPEEDVEEEVEEEPEEEEDPLTDPRELLLDNLEVASGNHRINDEGEECVALTATVADEVAIELDLEVSEDEATVPHIDFLDQ